MTETPIDPLGGNQINLNDGRCPECGDPTHVRHPQPGFIHRDHAIGQPCNAQCGARSPEVPTALIPDCGSEPTEPGWYSQSGTSGHMIYSRSQAGDWYAHTLEGCAWTKGKSCAWAYIDQAGPVFKVVLP